MIETFEQWIQHVFDRPVSDPEWYWEEEGDIEPSPEKTVEYFTLLFSNPTPILSAYSDSQVDQGLWFLISQECSDHAWSLLNTRVDWEKRQDGIRAIYSLFEKLFAQRCTPHLSHRAHLDKVEIGKINSVCFMWWDIFPAYGKSENLDMIESDREFICVMEKILSLDSSACQESALHGLGHWRYSYPDQVKAIIVQWLKKNQKIQKELRNYAEAAIEGNIQ